MGTHTYTATLLTRAEPAHTDTQGTVHAARYVVSRGHLLRFDGRKEFVLSPISHHVSRIGMSIEVHYDVLVCSLTVSVDIHGDFSHAYIVSRSIRLVGLWTSRMTSRLISTISCSQPGWMCSNIRMELWL